jgi:hypothetical protein
MTRSNRIEIGTILALTAVSVLPCLLNRYWAHGSKPFFNNLLDLND